MQTLTMNWNQYPALQNKTPEFLEVVATFATRISRLSEDQKQKLALFKASELLNALAQIRERKDDPDRIGPDKAAASFKIVRAAIRNRHIALPDGETVSLRDPELREIIDEGCQLFHRGKKDPEEWERAMAFSTAQYITLSDYLPGELDRYVQQFPDLFSDSLVQDVKETFIFPYQV